MIYYTDDNNINFSNRKGTKSRKTRTIRRLNVQQQRELRDFHKSYRRDTNIISRVIALERRLGHPPSILDLFCAGFTPSEIHSVDWQLVWLYGANWAYETSIPVPDIATYDVGGRCRMISNFKMLSSPRNLSKGGFRIDPSQFPRYSMYKHTTVQKLNGSKKVTVGVWTSTTQTPHTPGFIPNFHWYRTTDKSSYSNRNSAKQVPQIEGLPEQQQTTMTPSHVVKVIAQ